MAAEPRAALLPRRRGAVDDGRRIVRAHHGHAWGGVAGASPPVHLVVKSTGQALPPTQTVEEARVFHLSVDHDLEAVIGGGANRCTKSGGGC